ncbi:MAG: Hsp33 family molecular chaperone HslO [Christensenellales bacterium]|jgi:molecular chaperone Hsp33
MNESKLLYISLMDGMARAHLCDSTRLVETARETHSLSRIATAALGRHLTATAIIACNLKGKDDNVTCRINGGGPLGTLLAVGKSDGTVKGYVENPFVDLPRETEKLPVGAAVGKNGRLAVVRDLGLRDPYVGHVHLVSGEIAEDFAMYFTASEQTPSLVSLGVLTDDKVIAAGGLIVQMMPGATKAAIQSIESSAPMFMNLSATVRDYGLHGAAEQLLSHLQPQILEERNIAYRCDCSRDRVERALISLGRAELNEMIDSQHKAEVNCHFCNRVWRFSEDDLRALLASATKE